MTDVSGYYGSSDQLTKVRTALDQLEPDGGTIPLESLAGFDHFHTGGPVATTALANLLDLGPDSTVLDAGCGAGGPARALAARFGCRVIGVDLTPMFVDIARLLNDRTGYSELVDPRVGDIIELDLPDASVDAVFTQHVAMNIADRPRLYGELRRVLRPGGKLALFDVVDGGGGELRLPVPWAAVPGHSHLVTRDAMRELLTDAAFSIDVWKDPTAQMLGMMQELLRASPPSEPPRLGFHLYVEDMPTKLATYVRNLEEGRTALLMAIATAA